MKKQVLMRIVAAAVMVAGMAAAGGCAQNEITHLGVLLNMTPELESVADTPAQRQNKIARSLDHTMQQIWDDLDNLWLVNEPSKMSRFPIP